MRPAAALLIFSSLAVPALGHALTYKVVIHRHAFVPASLTVAPGKRVKLRVKNARHLPSEFESFDLNREKVVPPGSTITVWIGPLSPGKYKFFDDFNTGVTGWIVARARGGKTHQ